MLSRTGAQFSGAPNFAYELCTRKTTAAERAALDLAQLAAGVLRRRADRPAGARRIRRSVCCRGSSRRNAFYPCYGLAEATLMVTGGAGPSKPRVVRADRARLAANQLVDAGPSADAQPLVSCGQALGDQEVLVVDPQTAHARGRGRRGRNLDPRRLGGSWLLESTPRIRSRRSALELADGRGPFLRTGDLGSVLAGELFITGRLKDVIIIRGRNLYPQDIERTTQQAHEAVDAGAAFSVGEPGHEELVVVHQVGREHRRSDMAPVLRAIRAADRRGARGRPAGDRAAAAGDPCRSRPAARCSAAAAARCSKQASSTSSTAGRGLPSRGGARVALDGGKGDPPRPKFLDHVAGSTPAESGGRNPNLDDRVAGGEGRTSSRRSCRRSQPSPHWASTR